MLLKLFAILRIAMGWTFFWAFFDKLYGLGFATPKEGAWLNGGSPTFGFLNFATKGPFSEFFQSLAGAMWVDWFFMTALLLMGTALILGIGVKLASWGGALLLVIMYIAGFMPPEHNPFLDEHLLNTLILLAFPIANAGDTWGFGRWWSSTSLVQKFTILK
ncbi:MAG: hypothetical protein A3F94_01035 [Candidatus Spechtbacteria bacterium RIFCSPLOWO2_12_FULL_38_22]|uniref:DoxX family protein n=1 Tax=Candidatus Spechtbacteria bacterium RIFCSPLOWO2_12_FULL_38_22 TaxID=1802165 RepID=A0A1G2HIU7_9BACT|nr:MAG: hypothetical protein A2728_01575 [Candidatus Spechtbacteria bacterium RIFCSPHIGHO2_01_FULL_38_11]OGZ59855.1 MAG: hypothetical protein A3E58_02095 [Candidatus Spechtbacteria bacterium RIFCSPHIGHO2_12_FULL_38_30]OGZ60748.1 MAG: hypothetical protein A3A00_02460 [Candidatus Spechtbacteria bacterium RIFCSPLOWO2_01_FULL_38_20]OGZ62151.1 MAG: hypothetical protein A3F94_01035 [Candidatus Spechtbacteria bacterium RIFCSPLOWO2_12_FULL_38_22]